MTPLRIAGEPQPDEDEMSETTPGDARAGSGVDQEGSTARTEAPRDATITADHLVWSMEHDAWWAPDECGYTSDVEAAGRYTRQRAHEIAANADPYPRRERAVLADARHERVATANALIRTIAGCGRGFFARDGRIGRIEIDGRGRLWFRDAYAGRRVYTAYRGNWRHFTNGGTLRRVVECLCEYIKTGERLPDGIFGPWPEWVCGGDMWAYGAENMAAIRSAATELGMLAPLPPERAPALAVDPSWSTPNTNTDPTTEPAHVG